MVVEIFERTLPVIMAVVVLSSLATMFGEPAKRAITVVISLIVFILLIGSVIAPLIDYFKNQGGI